MSLRLRVVVLTGLALLLLWAGAATWMLRGIQTKLEHTLDGRLAMSARMVAGLVSHTSLDIPASAVQFDHALKTAAREGIACEIRTMQGEVLSRHGEPPINSAARLPTGFSTKVVAGTEWRIYVLRDDAYQVTTADRIDERSNLTDRMRIAAGLPFLIAVIGGLGVLWIGISRGLAPLSRLSQELTSRDADSVAPVDAAHYPTELEPMLQSLNALVARLIKTVNNQRAFTDAAAHELRTPLTIIDTHLQVARQSTGDAVAPALDNAQQGVRRLRHTLDQMLALVRADSPDMLEQSSVSLADVLADSVLAIAPQQRSRVELGDHGEDIAVAMPRPLLQTAIKNLLDNALRYSPVDTNVVLRMSWDKDRRRCLLSVLDRGPGLSANQAEQIGRRFWRGDHGRLGAEGSGLGISIVRTIVERFGGRLEFVARDGGGLEVLLDLPAHAPTLPP